MIQRLLITATAMVPPLVLIFAVLGTIMLGWATPTEAAAMGAIGTVILTLIYGRFSFATLQSGVFKDIASNGDDFNYSLRRYDVRWSLRCTWRYQRC